MKPVLDDDALILALDSLPEAQQLQSSGGTQSSDETNTVLAASLQEKNEQLRSELDSLTKQFENYRLAVQKTLDQRWGVDEESQAAAKNVDSAKDTKSATAVKSDGSEKAPVAEGTDYYFESYSHSGTYFVWPREAENKNDESIWLTNLALLCRYPRDNAEGHDSDGCLPRFHLR